jgi:cytochrome P450
MFFNEVLRMFPIGNRVVQRRATKDTVVQEIKIGKGKVEVHGIVLVCALP